MVDVAVVVVLIRTHRIGFGVANDILILLFGFLLKTSSMRFLVVVNILSGVDGGTVHWRSVYIVNILTNIIRIETTCTIQ
jgi:hypothetical protein